MRRICAFCPAEAVEVGGEHLWDDWINKAQPETRYRARRQYSRDSEVIEFETDSLNEQLPVVCHKCNNNWMSVLSAKVKERFSKSILDGEPFSLGARDAAVLAAFSFMKAVVTDHLINSDDPFFSRAAREKFRTSRSLPPLLKVWFAASQEKYRMSARNNLSLISGSEPGPLCGMQFYSHTYLVGNLALQLLAPRWKHINDRGRPLVALTPDVCWKQTTTLFWPHSGGFLSWPPPKYIGDDTIQGFIHRFKSPVKLRIPISRFS